MTTINRIAPAAPQDSLSTAAAAEYARRFVDAAGVAEEQGLAGPEADLFAATEVATMLERRATVAHKQLQRTVLAIDSAWERAVADEDGPDHGVAVLFGERIAAQQRVNLAKMQALLTEGLRQVPNRETPLPWHTVDALYGNDSVTDPATKAAARAWTDALTWWGDAMQRAIIEVGALPDWRLPQHFQSDVVRALGRDGFVVQMEGWWRDGALALRDWAADGRARLQPGRDINSVGSRRDDTSKARVILSGAFDAILAGRDSGEAHGASLAVRYERRRVFEWTSGDAWLAFNNRLGLGDDAIGELMRRHLEELARDLAVAQLLGLDPDRSARTLIARVEEATGSRAGTQRLQALYAAARGQAPMPLAPRPSSAPAPSTLGFLRATTTWRELDLTRFAALYVGRLDPARAADRAEAKRSRLVLEAGLRGLQEIVRDTLGDCEGGAAESNKHGDDNADVKDGYAAAGDEESGRNAGPRRPLNGIARIAGRQPDIVVPAQGHFHRIKILSDVDGMVSRFAPRGAAASASPDALGVFPLAAFLDEYFQTLDGVRDDEGRWLRGPYLASAIVVATVLGALSLQLSSIAAGRAAESTDDERAWARAFAEGGAADLFEDQLRALLPKSATDANLAARHVQDLWYARLALDRLVWSTLVQMADPDTAGAFTRMQEHVDREQDSSFYWRPTAGE